MSTRLALLRTVAGDVGGGDDDDDDDDDDD